MLELKNHVWSEIDLDAIQENVCAYGSLASDSKIIAVIKANAYGHGAFETAKLLSTNSNSSFFNSSIC